MIKIEQIKLPVTHTEEELEKAIERRLGRKVGRNDLGDRWRILRKSLDCRKKPELFYIYSIGVFVDKKTEAEIRRRKKAERLIFTEETVYRLPVETGIGVRELAGNIRERELLDRTETIRIESEKAGNAGAERLRPVIVGDGPAGLFCAYILTLSGFRPVVFERGEDIDSRTERVKAFWEGGELSPESNVQFGEGGAGTFSDGKLNSGIKDKAGRIAFVLETFVKSGAKHEIIYDSKPHIGTDELRKIIKNMRLFMERRGCEFRFNSKVTDIIIEDGSVSGVVYEAEDEKRSEFQSDTVVLAIGHSSRDTLEMLYEKKIKMDQKDFAMGFRVMHPQELIDKAQYGEENLGSRAPAEQSVADDITGSFKEGVTDALGLPASDYKLAVTTSGGERVYSFCMCPGGYVVNASSEKSRLCVNGMSYADRASGEANSAIVAAFTKEDYGSDHPLSGMYLQRKIEEKAYKLGNGKIPIQRFVDFRDGIIGQKTLAHDEDRTVDGKDSITEIEDEAINVHGLHVPADDVSIRELRIKGDYEEADLRGIFTDKVNLAIIEAVEAFDRTIKGFAGKEAVFAGVESRTSSPVRIERDEESFMGSIKGLYPCGEGAGYAGGIMSAAVDGIKTAEHVIYNYLHEPITES